MYVTNAQRFRLDGVNSEALLLDLPLLGIPPKRGRPTVCPAWGVIGKQGCCG